LVGTLHHRAQSTPLRGVARPAVGRYPGVQSIGIDPVVPRRNVDRRPVGADRWSAQPSPRAEHAAARRRRDQRSGATKGLHCICVDPVVARRNVDRRPVGADRWSAHCITARRIMR
jgi:hypothetical protein